MKNQICNYIFKDFEVKEEQYLWFFFSADFGAL